MTLIEIRGTDGRLIGRCDARCYNAITPQCECCCGGKNHGRGAGQALAQTREHAFNLIPKHWKQQGEAIIPVLEIDEQELQEQIERERHRPIIQGPRSLRGEEFFTGSLFSPNAYSYSRPISHLEDIESEAGEAHMPSWASPQGGGAMKVYEGKRMKVADPFLGVGTSRHSGWVEHTALVVTVNGQPLDPRLDFENRSPTGFECGYMGSGPRQLAIAILADFLGPRFLEDRDRAAYLSYYFMSDVIAQLPRDHDWQLTAEEIEQFLERYKEVLC
jgi:hypothetical protein